MDEAYKCGWTCHCACIYLCESLTINLCPKILKVWDDFLIYWFVQKSYVDICPNSEKQSG